MPAPNSLPFECPTTHARHLGRGPGLVDESEADRIGTKLAFEPRLAAAQDVRTVLLARMGGLF
jgi:hypothetical protein